MPSDRQTIRYARQLKAARKAAGLGLRPAARALGISHPQVVSLERGTRSVSVWDLLTLAKAYRVPVADLLPRR